MSDDPAVTGDHPHTDPGDGRTECETCGKWVWLVTHSCKGVRLDRQFYCERHPEQTDPLECECPDVEPPSDSLRNDGSGARRVLADADPAVTAAEKALAEWACNPRPTPVSFAEIAVEAARPLIERRAKAEALREIADDADRWHATPRVFHGDVRDFADELRARADGIERADA